MNYTNRDKPCYTHISGWKGSYQGCQTTRRLKEERLVEDFFASVSQLTLFMSSLFLCVYMSVCVFVSRLPFGWLLWYYWVSDKPAREAPMGCTKCFPLAGVGRGAVGCSISRRAGRRIGGWVCSWFPLSNRSLAGAQGLHIPGRCWSVCKCVFTLIHTQEPEETAVHFFTIQQYKQILHVHTQRGMIDIARGFIIIRLY